MWSQPARDLVGLPVEFNRKGYVRVVQVRRRAVNESLVKIQDKSDGRRRPSFPRESGRSGLGNVWGKVFDKPVSASRWVGSNKLKCAYGEDSRLTDQTPRCPRRRLPLPDPRRCRPPPCVNGARGGVRVPRAFPARVRVAEQQPQLPRQ
jgi:hypothetical protein